MLKNIQNTIADEVALIMMGASWLQLAALCLVMALLAMSEGIGFLILVPMLEAMNGAVPLPRSLAARFGLEHLSFSLGLLLGLFVFLIGARICLQYLANLLGLRLQNDVVDTLRIESFSAILRAEWRTIARQRRSDFSSFIITNIDRIGYGLNQFTALAGLVGTGVACIAAASLLSWRLTLCTVLSGVIVMAAYRGQRRLALKLGREESAAYDAIYAEIDVALSGLRVAKAFGRESQHIERVRAALLTLRSPQLAFVRATAAGRIWLHVGSAALLSLIIYLGRTRWHIPVYQLLPLILLFARFIPLMSAAQQSWESWLRASPALADTMMRLNDAHRNCEPPVTHDAPALPFNEAIKLVGVGVHYTDRASPTLSEVSLEISARTTTYIIGKSGAGKSTLADVLMGMIVPDEGSVKVDGIPLTGSSRMQWRKSVAYIQQDAFLFAASIRSNLLWAVPEASDEEIDEALEAASAGFVHDLPEGLDTLVGDYGVLLSGGERQRIVLARALLKRPSLLVMDEAMSALDPQNEMKIRQTITALHGSVTVVVIGHREKMIDSADQIIRIDRGRATVTNLR